MALGIEQARSTEESMKLNGIKKIDESKGRYIVLVDYGTEGIVVDAQAESLEEAVQHALSCTHGPCSIVQLSEVNDDQP